ncbi:MAG: hypothetical protein ACPGSB_02210 [Opitutales bacterium]
MQYYYPNTIVLVGVFVVCPLLGQKTSTWDGDGSDDNWTTTQNWDTAEDPNGNDTAIVPSPFEIILDANRSVGQLDLRGQTGNFVEISGSAQLTVQNKLLWKDSVLSGAGTFISSTNSNFQGVTAFNGWSVTLSGTTTMQTGFMASSGSVNLNGTINWGAAGLTGPTGNYTIAGTFTKNTADANHSSLFDPGSLTISGTLAAEKGIIVLQPDAFNPTGATFATGAEGRLRLQADTVTYNNTQFLNNNQMDITDNVLGTKESIGFSGTIESTGTNPVILGTNGKYRSDNATFSGPWEMRGASLMGTLTTSGGGFNWRNGNLGPSVTHTGTASGDFIISNNGGAPAPELHGSFTNQGHVTQLRSLTVNEDSSGTSPTDGSIILQGPGTWELSKFAGLIEGTYSGGNLPTLEIESGGTLAHIGDSSSDRSEVELQTTLETGGTVRNDAGTLEFAGLLNQFNGFFNANNADGLNSVIKLDGISRLNASVGMIDGGVFELSENAPGTFLTKLSAAGTGEVVLDDGTLIIEPKDKESAAAITIGGPDEDGLGEDGVIMRIRNKSGAPQYAIAFDPSDTSSKLFSKLNVSGPVEWTGRSIGIPLETGDPTPAEDSRGELNIAEDGSLTIPSGAPSMNDVKLTNTGTVQHGTGGSSSPAIEVRRAKIVNQGEWRISGNGNINTPEGPLTVVLENSATGTVRKDSGSGTSSLSVTIDNEGTVECSSGELDISGPVIGYDPATKTITKGRWRATDGGSIRFSSIASLEVFQGPENDTVTMTPPSDPRSFVNFPKLELSSSGELVLAQSQFLNENDDALFAQAQLTIQGNARLEVKGSSELEFGGVGLEIRESALLGGDGHILANSIKIEFGSWISPGNSPGTLTLTGDFQMLTDSRYFFEASSSSVYDQIVVNGDVTLSGFFVPDFLDGYTPTVGTSFTVITADSISGSFQGQVLGYLEGNIAFDFVNTGTELIATVISSSPTDFNTWQAQNFFPEEIADPSISGEGADPEKDGITNFWEFTSGTRARLEDSIPWSFSNIVAPDGTDPASVELSFRWRTGMTGLDFVVEQTDDLETSWTPSSVEILSDVTVDGFREITLRASGADENAVEEFFRLATEETD